VPAVVFCQWCNNGFCATCNIEVHIRSRKLHPRFPIITSTTPTIVTSLPAAITTSNLVDGPVHFIWMDQKSMQWVINPLLKSTIEAIRGPIVIIAIAGPCRTGKVSLSNHSSGLIYYRYIL
jgi:hypothetical protein